MMIGVVSRLPARTRATSIADKAADLGCMALALVTGAAMLYMRCIVVSTPIWQPPTIQGGTMGGAMPSIKPGQRLLRSTYS